MCNSVHFYEITMDGGASSGWRYSYALVLWAVDEYSSIVWHSSAFKSCDKKRW